MNNSHSHTRRISVLEYWRQWQAQTLSGLRGDVLDVGAGDGTSLEHLPHDTTVYLLEPSARMARKLDNVAARRSKTHLVQSEAENIPLHSQSIDTAISSLTLCSVTDQNQALAEIHRVLRPEGRLVFIEHVAAPAGTGIRRLQSLVAPFSRGLQRGCDPRRDTGQVVKQSEFEIMEYSSVQLQVGFGLSWPVITGVAQRKS